MVEVVVVVFDVPFAHLYNCFGLAVVFHTFVIVVIGMLFLFVFADLFCFLRGRFLFRQ